MGQSAPGHCAANLQNRSLSERERTRGRGSLGPSVAAGGTVPPPGLPPRQARGPCARAPRP